MACPNCGSWAVKADRSLAGRMVCARCGEPLGIGRARQIARGSGGGGLGRGRALTLPRRWRLWLVLGTLLTVSALLAAVPERPRRPLDRPGFDATRGAVRRHRVLPGALAGVLPALSGMSPSADSGDPGLIPSGIMRRNYS